MALLGNFHRLNLGVGRAFATAGGTSTSSPSNTPGSRSKGGEWFNWILQSGRTTVLSDISKPSGYYAPAVYYMAIKAGEMSWQGTGDGSITVNLYGGKLMTVALSGSGSVAWSILGRFDASVNLTGSGSITATAAAYGNMLAAITGSSSFSATAVGTLNATVAMTGSGSLTADAALLVSMLCAMTGSGTMTSSASLLATMLCAMSGSGTLTPAIVGQFNAAVNMTGAGSMTASMNALANAVCALTGHGSLTVAMAAFADMRVDIVVTGTGLTTSNVGQAVWDAIAAANNNPGTMGEKLNDAGSASNPWTEVIESGVTAAEILRLLAAVSGGKSGIVDNGGGSATVTFRDLADSKDRVEVDMTGSERTTVTLDLT